MNIRPALPSESNILFDIDRTQTFSAHWKEADWQAELAHPAARVWAAFVDERLVGFICVRGAAGQYEITNLAVAVGHTRQGIGRALLTHALRQLKELGAAQVTLEVSTANEPARALYQSGAFSTLGVRKKFYPDGSDALILGKRL